MALTTARIGIYEKQADSDTINVDRMRVFGPQIRATRNMWGIGVGWWGGRNGASSPLVTAAVYADMPQPFDRMAMTTEVSVGTSMSDSSGGTRYERTFTTIDIADDYPRPNTKLPIITGRDYTVALLAEDEIFRYSVWSAGSVPSGSLATNERGGLTEPPASYTSTTGVSPAYQTPTLYIYGYDNEAPETPTSLSPASLEQSLTPTFTANFRDLNGAYGDSSGNGVDTGDAIGGYQIQLRDQPDGAGNLLWNSTYNATTGEQTANQMSRAYGGSALVRGSTYYWRCRHRDLLGDWGPWSGWEVFYLADRGFVTLDGTPTGKQLVVTGINFQGRWTSAQSLATDRVQIRLVAGGTSLNPVVLQTSPEITKAVAHSAAPGTLFTITWAESTFSTLAWSTNYGYQIRGRDSAGQWSNWSATRLFWTDMAPSIPSNLSPANNIIQTALPKLTSVTSDIDDADAVISVVYRLTRPDTTTVDVTGTYNAVTDKHEFQTTTTQLNQYGTYQLKATGYDGTLYSGGSTTLGGASWSSTVTFQYLAGPTVSITSPADDATITSSSMTVTYTTTGQVSRRIRLIDMATADIVYDTGEETTASTTHTIPAGSYRNNRTYVLTVYSTNSTPLTGADTHVIHIAYTPATALSNVQIVTERYELDPVDTGVAVTWDPTSYPTTGDPRFLGYSVYRTVVGHPTDSARRRLLFEENPAVTSFSDPHPPSGYPVLYEVVQSVYTGVDTVDSTAVSDTIEIDLGQFHILSSMVDPLQHRTVLTNVQQKPEAFFADQTPYQSLAGGPPVTIYGPATYSTRSIAAAIIAHENTTADQLKEALVDLRQQNDTVVYRDGAGNKKYYAMTSLDVVPQIGDTGGRWYTTGIGLREENVVEGELAG